MDEEKLTIKERIEILIRARYPLINIVSSEEARVEQTIKAIARSRGKRYFIWSVTKGLQSDDGSCAADLREPIKALDHILEGDVNGIFLLKDFHPFLNDPVVVRKVRDIARELKTTMKNVVLLSPMLRIPLDVEKEVSIVDFDLPGKETLGKIIDDITATLTDKGRVWIGGVTREKVVEAALGLTAEEAENVFAKSLVQTGGFDIPVILSEKEQIIRKSGVLEYYRAHEEMTEIGGLENLKQWLNKRSQAFTREAREFGLPEPKGILM
ncbi:MAG: ATPase, partial [Spirochaetales bacterium]|nr:ATPase [Spirochaetales bacterium]